MRLDYQILLKSPSILPLLAGPDPELKSIARVIHSQHFRSWTPYNAKALFCKNDNYGCYLELR